MPASRASYRLLTRSALDTKSASPGRDPLFCFTCRKISRKKRVITTNHIQAKQSAMGKSTKEKAAKKAKTLARMTPNQLAIKAAKDEKRRLKTEKRALKPKAPKPPKNRQKVRYTDTNIPPPPRLMDLVHSFLAAYSYRKAAHGMRSDNQKRQGHNVRVWQKTSETMPTLIEIFEQWCAQNPEEAAGIREPRKMWIPVDPIAAKALRDADRAAKEAREAAPQGGRAGPKSLSEATVKSLAQSADSGSSSASSVDDEEDEEDEDSSIARPDGPEANVANKALVTSQDDEHSSSESSDDAHNEDEHDEEDSEDDETESSDQDMEDSSIKRGPIKATHGARGESETSEEESELDNDEESVDDSEDETSKKTTTSIEKSLMDIEADEESTSESEDSDSDGESDTISSSDSSEGVEVTRLVVQSEKPVQGLRTESSDSSSGSESESAIESDSSDDEIEVDEPLSSSTDLDSSSESESDSGAEIPVAAAVTSPVTESSSTLQGNSIASSSSALSDDSSSSADESSPKITEVPFPQTKNNGKRKRGSEDEQIAVIPATQENVKRLKKDNIPFSRIPTDIKVEERFASNKYVPYDYANKAHQDLIVTKGKGFTKEKNKKKKGQGFRGGMIDIDVKRGIKFDD